jgi:hypothetical protein
VGLVEFSEFGFGLDEHGNIGVGVFPEIEKLLEARAGFVAEVFMSAELAIGNKATGERGAEGLGGAASCIIRVLGN